MLHCTLQAVIYILAKFKYRHEILKQVEIAVRSMRDSNANKINSAKAFARVRNNFIVMYWYVLSINYF